MSFLHLLKASLFRFSELKQANKIPFWKAVIYLIVLSFIMALPTVYQASLMLKDVKQDGTTIAEKIPNFKIQDGKLESGSDGFIYQTDSIIFTFDPEGKRSEKEVSKDLMGNLFSIGFLKNEIIVALPQSSMLDNNVFKLPYTQEPLKSMTDQSLKKIITEMKLPFWGYLLMWAAAFYPTFLNLLMTIFFATLGALIYSRLRQLPLTFADCFKTMIFCSTIPILLSTIFLLFKPNFDAGTLVTLISLFAFFQVTKSYNPHPLS